MLVTTGFNSTQSPVFTLGNWACLPLFHFWPGWTSPSFYSPLEHMPLGSINSCSALKNQDNVAAQMRIIAMPPGHDGNLWHQYLLFSCFKSYLYINGNATYSTTSFYWFVAKNTLRNEEQVKWALFGCRPLPAKIYLRSISSVFLFSTFHHILSVGLVRLLHVFTPAGSTSKKEIADGMNCQGKCMQGCPLQCRVNVTT